jgi:hypothetical protein
MFANRIISYRRHLRCPSRGPLCEMSGPPSLPSPLRVLGSRAGTHTSAIQNARTQGTHGRRASTCVREVCEGRESFRTGSLHIKRPRFVHKNMASVSASFRTSNSSRNTYRHTYLLFNPRRMGNDAAGEKSSAKGARPCPGTECHRPGWTAGHRVAFGARQPMLPWPCQSSARACRAASGTLAPGDMSLC